MLVDVPLIWILVAFNALFLTAFVYRRLTDRPPLNGVLAILAQTLFIAINCMVLFPEEVSQLVDQLIRLI
jgi:branched-subunit amino acid ABC-type transport system permease component